MLTVFRQPYPFEEPASRSWWRAFWIGLFVGLFLLAFQPFGTEQWETPNKSLKLLGFGFISFALTAFNFLVWPRLFPRIFQENTWTVGKAILFIIANVLLIAVVNRLYLAWLMDHSAHDLPGMIIITFLVGIFPITGGIIASYILKLRQYAQQAATLRPQSVSSAMNERSEPTLHGAVPDVVLVADNEKERLILPPADLLYLESSDNYCTVVYLKNGQPTRPLLRSSLSRLESQLTQTMPSDRNPFVRCHRSYVVNLDRVERVSGNAQGYRLHLLNDQFSVPVARQYNDTLVAELRNK